MPGPGTGPPPGDWETLSWTHWGWRWYTDYLNLHLSHAFTFKSAWHLFRDRQFCSYTSVEHCCSVSRTKAFCHCRGVIAVLFQFADKIHFELGFSQFCSFLANDQAYIKPSHPTDPQYYTTYFPPVVLSIVWMTAERIKFLWCSADSTTTVQVPRELKIFRNSEIMY
jgi:hypothetical protein